MDDRKKRALNRYIIIALFVAFAISAFSIMNVLVSMKYETTGNDPCISIVSGRDLCVELLTSKIMTVVLLAAAIAMIVVKRNKV